MEIYRVQKEVTKEGLAEIPEDFIIRNIAAQFIRDLPVEKLKKLFNIQIINPESDESSAILRDQKDRRLLSDKSFKRWRLDVYEIEALKERGIIKYKAQIKI